MKKIWPVLLVLLLGVSCCGLPLQAAADSGLEGLTIQDDGSIVAAEGDTRAAVAGFGSETEGHFEPGTIRDLVRTAGLRLEAQARTCTAWGQTVTAEAKRVQDAAQAAAQKPPAQEPVHENVAIHPDAFYGVWCAATKDFPGAQAIAYNLTLRGYDARVYLSTDWSNLNIDPWYVVAAGVYGSRNAAEAALPGVQAIYKDAYVKYSGSYIGQGPSIDQTQQTEQPEVSGGLRTSFYGIWCAASRDYADAQKTAAELTRLGFDGQVYLSSDWGNLNREPWYVVTAGAYGSKGAAEAALPGVQAVYKDAYVKYSGSYIGQDQSAGQTEPPEAGETVQTPFYGIWCAASRDYADAQKTAGELTRLGFGGQVYLSTDWSNLNREPWYVVTAGVYSSREAADAVLPDIQFFYPDAYVKYSGSWQG